MIHFTLGGILAALVFIAYILIRIEHKIYSNERKSVRKHEQTQSFGCNSCKYDFTGNYKCKKCDENFSNWTPK